MVAALCSPHVRNKQILNFSVRSYVVGVDEFLLW